jgi:hypothetical protein
LGAVGNSAAAWLRGHRLRRLGHEWGMDARCPRSQSGDRTTPSRPSVLDIQGI